MPTYNEINNLPITLQAVLEAAPSVDILVVDDNSPDGTGRLADKLAASNNRVNVLHRNEKNGLGPAYLAGFAWGTSQGYETLVEMDADGSHRAVDLPKLLAETESADLVIGSRWIRGGAVKNWPWHRKMISRSGNIYANLMLGAKIADITAGFRAYRTSFLESLDLENIASHGYSFQVELAYRSRQAGAVIKEVPILFLERENGVSKMSSGIVVEALWLVTKWGFARALPSKKRRPTQSQIDVPEV